MGKEGERGRKHQCVVASHGLPTGGLAHNPGMFPDWELDPRPFGSQASTQSTEPHQPGIVLSFIVFIFISPLIFIISFFVLSFVHSSFFSFFSCKVREFENFLRFFEVSWYCYEVPS